jgi:hypothetical protein
MSLHRLIASCLGDLMGWMPWLMGGWGGHGALEPVHRVQSRVNF